MSTKKTKKAQNMIKSMSASKKKLHEMVEALINGDSNTAASSLHDYLQVKTRTVLGETDEEMDDEMVADRHDEDGEGEMDADGDHDGDEVCPECGEEPCECEGGEGDEDHEDFDADAEFGGEEDGEHEEHMHEGNLTKARGNHFEKNTAKVLDRKIKGTLNYDKTSASGTKKSTSGMKPTSMKKNSMGAKDLTSTVKGKIKFDKSSGTKSDSSGAKKTAMKKNSMGSKDLESRVKGNVKFSSSKARTNNV